MKKSNNKRREYQSGCYQTTGYLCTIGIIKHADDYDEKNAFRLKTYWKIDKNILYFSTMWDNIKCQQSKEPTPHCYNGSPYYGCDYEYRDCEAFNWTYMYYYKVPLIGWYSEDKKVYFRGKNGFLGVIESVPRGGFPELTKL